MDIPHQQDGGYLTSPLKSVEKDSYLLSKWEQSLKDKEAQLRERELQLLKFEKQIKSIELEYSIWLNKYTTAIKEHTQPPEPLKLPLSLETSFLKLNENSENENKIKSEKIETIIENANNSNNSNVPIKKAPEISAEDKNLINLIEESAKVHTAGRVGSNITFPLDVEDIGIDIPEPTGHENQTGSGRGSLQNSTQTSPILTSTTSPIIGSISDSELTSLNGYKSESGDSATGTGSSALATGFGYRSEPESTFPSYASEPESTNNRSTLKGFLTEAGTRHSLFDEQKELDKDLSALRDSIKRHSKLDFNKVGNDRPTNDPLAKRPNSSVNLTTFLSSPSSESHTNRPSPRPGHHSPSTEELSQIFPVDIVALASKIQGLAEILQPYRKLMFKFNAIVDLEQEREVSTNFMNGIFRRIRPKDIKPTVLPTKCLIILFNDILCICTAQKLKAALPIVETWIDTEILPKLCERGLYPFHISTPEKLFLCYLDEESKLHLLNRIWESTLKARLVQENKYLGDAKRLLYYQFKSGQIYEGEWKGGKFNGKGLQILPYGEKYDGNFLNGKRNGYGSLTYANSQRYEGYWKLGKRHGKGTQYYSSSDPFALKFNGNWFEDQQHGEGELFLKNGTILKAVWKIGFPTSPCVLYLDSRQTRYIGDLSESYLRDGFGICIYSNFDRFYGKWSHGERAGNGLFVTNSGTEYNGEWAADKMEGRGILCFGNDESTINGKFSSLPSGSIRVEGELKLGIGEEQPRRLSTVQGFKWSTFFTLRLMSMESSENTETLNQHLIRTVNEKQPEDIIRQDLLTIFYCKQHPLGKLLFEFIQIFNAMFTNLRIDQVRFQLPAAVDDILSFMSLLSGSFIRQYLNCPGVSNEDCTHALNDAIFPEVYETLMEMYNNKYEEENQRLETKMKNILALPVRQRMAVCGIDEKYWNQIEDIIQNDIKLKAIDLDPSVDETPYQGAVQAIRSLSAQKTVSKKLACIKLAASRVETLLKKLVNQFGADEFLPLFCLVMMEAANLNLQSECNFMDDFIDDELRYNVYGYMLTQLQIASAFILNCDIHEKLEKTKLI